MRTFQYGDAKSHKFWSIDVKGSTFTVTFGKVGTAGQTQTKTFPSAEKAQAEADKLIREKTGKGYVELTPKAAASEVDALEQAVRADPYDRAAHAALADWLAEHGDPRGEFMQVQLALEDESVPTDRRKQLKAREKELLDKHEREWVGAWVDIVGDPENPESDSNEPTGGKKYAFEGGLLTTLNIGRLNVPVARAVVAAPELRFVRNLFVGDVPPEADEEEDEFEEGPDIPEDIQEYHGQYPLLRWPQLRHIRRFGWGWPVREDDKDYHYRSYLDGDRVYDFVKQMPDIEELRILAHVGDARKLVALPMPNLHVFQLYHGSSYPLDKLAANKSLGKLTHILCHPHALEIDDDPYIRLKELRAICRAPHLTNLTHLRLRNSDVGDAGAMEIATTGILKHLKVLELQLGCISDEGAKALAASPDLRNLSLLDLSHNALTPEGIKALAATGVKVVAEQQHTQTRYDPDDDIEFLWHGDSE